MIEVEFRVLCADEEACKRVRFGMETGVYVKPFVEDRKEFLGEFYEELKPAPSFNKTIKNCEHDVSMNYHHALKRNPNYSIEANCLHCRTVLTLTPFSFKEVFEKKGIDKIPQDLRYLENEYGLAITDFPNYDEYGKKGLYEKFKEIIVPSVSR